MTAVTSNWLDPLNRERIQNAVRGASPVVVLRDGRRFNLTYNQDRGYGTVTIVPDNNVVGYQLTPRGEFDIKRILDPLWVEEEGTW